MSGPTIAPSLDGAAPVDRQAMRLAVVMTTYNRPDALGAVLRALAVQTDVDFEVVVADDGSGPATAAAIRDAARTPRAPGYRRLLHAWHPDDGFRAAAVRNLAVAASQGAYLVFLDGDCLPRPDFLARHRLLAEPGYMVTGSRVLLSQALSLDALQQPGSADPIERRPLHWWLRRRLAGDANKAVPLLRVGDSPLRHYRKVAWRRIKSCNLAVWRRDFAAVDGFDEVFVGWGHEDADLALRLARAGVRRKGGAFSTEVFHLWHPDNPRGQEGENRRRVEARMIEGRVVSERGVSSQPTAESRIELVAGA
jgi:glycosyltransferase involved in cell wall biosynthesis